MAAPAILKLEIIADAKRALAALNQTGDAAKGATSKLGGLGKVAAGAFGTAAVISFGKASVGAALESEKATARLEQVFSSMGDTTGTAAKQAEKYAAALSKKVAVDDEAIMAAQAQLATFAAVSDETARTAGVFDRATAAAADLAAAGFGSLDTNSVQLGKALQDPTKGMTALTRSGVTFTNAQKEQIAALQESGDLLGAQKVVLAAVEKQVGGTAAATATSQEKMTLAFGETQEAVGGALLPVLEQLAPVLQTVAGFVQENATWLVPMAGAIAAVVVGVKAWRTAQVALNLIMGMNPWLLALAAVVAAIVLVVKNWDKVKAALSAVFDWIKRNWPTLLAILTGPFGLAVLAIVRNWDSIKAAAQKVLDWFKGVPAMVGAALRGVGDAITRPFKSAFNAVAGFWNDTVGSLSFKVPGWVPGIGGKGWEVPDIPRLANGGTVMRTGLALVHAGEQFSGVGRTFGSSTVINVNVATTGLGADAPEIQRAVVRAIRGYVGRNGPLDVPVRSAG